MATKKNTRNKLEQTSLPWGIILLSFALGAFVMFLLHLQQNVPADSLTEQSTGTNKVSEKQVQPTFDFYTLLPEVEVVVHSDLDKPSPEPVVTLPAEGAAQTVIDPQSKHSNKETVSYIVQAGSFRKAADAERYKARLALLGVQSSIQTVTIDNKDTWHRVQIGPIKGRQQANTLQQQLKQNQIQSLLMRAKQR